MENELKKYGWYLLREGGGHSIWTNGDLTEPVPRHNEINEYTAKEIIKKAKRNPGHNNRRKL